jgi:hypothetical protein
VKVTIYVCCGMSVLHTLECVREGEVQGGPQPSPGSSKLLSWPVPGHLGSARALWCAGEKWKC